MNSQYSKPTNSVPMLSSIDWDIEVSDEKWRSHGRIGDFGSHKWPGWWKPLKMTWLRALTNLIPNLSDLDMKKKRVDPSSTEPLFSCMAMGVTCEFLDLQIKGGPSDGHDVDCLVMSYEVCYNLEELFFLLMLTVIWCQGRNALKEHKKTLVALYWAGLVATVPQEKVVWSYP